MTGLGPPDRRQVLRMAWPIVLANSAVPLLGLVDTAVIGNTGTVAELGAIALGALVFNFLYWSFAFLRMGTTGFTAQAAGAEDETEVRATLGRALLMAAVIGASLVVLRKPIGWLALELLGATEEVESLTLGYYSIRIWGAPASLATFAVMGTFVGLGRSDRLLQSQLVLNGLNIVLDVLFAGVLGWGTRGIALGTAIAEWTALAFVLFLVRRVLAERRSRDGDFWPWERIFDRQKLLRTLSASADIMIRTLLLLLGFGWFTNQGALFGNDVLAANHVLLQLIALCAYFLDGYAFATEALVGRAIGARQKRLFDGAVRSANQLAAITAAALTGLVVVAGRPVIELLTDLEVIRDLATRYLPYAALYILFSFGAFQLDGIFIGATRTRDMRNASLLSLGVFFAASWPLIHWLGNLGLWIAFVLYVVARAVSLALRFPALRRSVDGG